MTAGVTVIGGGLAGCEAAWQIAKAGVSVKLYEMKPERFSPAHKSKGLAELICSNSLKAARTDKIKRQKSHDKPVEQDLHWPEIQKQHFRGDKCGSPDDDRKQRRQASGRA